MFLHKGWNIKVWKDISNYPKQFKQRKSTYRGESFPGADRVEEIVTATYDPPLPSCVWACPASGAPGTLAMGPQPA